MIKSFRGLLADGEEQRIKLSTMKGLVGYKINKFQVINQNPGSTAVKAVVKIYKTEQGSVDALIDFSAPLLLAAAFSEDNDSVTYVHGKTIIFDNEIFNQDIYITNKGHDATPAINYYIELEQRQLDLNENTVATLKDIRNLFAGDDPI